MPKIIKHINADVLSDDEMEEFSDRLKDAERKMDEKLFEEIYHRDDTGHLNDSGIWLPRKQN